MTDINKTKREKKNVEVRNKLFPKFKFYLENQVIQKMLTKLTSFL